MIAPTSPWPPAGGPGAEPPPDEPLAGEDDGLRGYLGLLQEKAGVLLDEQVVIRNERDRLRDRVEALQTLVDRSGQQAERLEAALVEAESLRQDLAPLRDRAASADALRQELVAAGGELVAALEQVAHYRQELPRLVAETQASSAAAELMRQRNELLRDQAGEAAVLRRERDAARVEADVALTFVATCQAEARAMGESARDLEETRGELDRYRSEADRLSAEGEATAAAAQVLREDLDTARREAAAARASLEAATADLVAARSYSAACEVDLRAERQASAAADERYRRESGSLLERAGALHQELILAEAEVHAARGHAAACLAEATSSLSESVASHVAFEGARVEIDRLRGEVERTGIAHESIATAAEGQRAELESTRRERDHLAEMARSLREEATAAEALRSELVAARRETDEVRARLGATLTQSAACHREAEAADALRVEIERAQAECDRLRGEAGRCRDGQESSAAEAATLRLELEPLRAELETVRRERDRLADLASLVHDQDATAGDLSLELDAARCECAVAHSAAAGHRLELDAVRGMAAAVMGKAAAASSAAHELKQELEAARGALAVLSVTSEGELRSTYEARRDLEEVRALLEGCRGEIRRLRAQRDVSAAAAEDLRLELDAVRRCQGPLAGSPRPTPGAVGDVAGDPLLLGLVNRGLPTAESRPIPADVPGIPMGRWASLATVASRPGGRCADRGEHPEGDPTESGIVIPPTEPSAPEQGVGSSSEQSVDDFVRDLIRSEGFRTLPGHAG